MMSVYLLTQAVCLASALWVWLWCMHVRCTVLSLSARCLSCFVCECATCTGTFVILWNKQPPCVGIPVCWWSENKQKKRFQAAPSSRQAIGQYSSYLRGVWKRLAAAAHADAFWNATVKLRCDNEWPQTVPGTCSVVRAENMWIGYSDQQHETAE